MSFINNSFDSEFYLSFYPDLKKAGIDETTAHHHYITYGKKENRVGTLLMLKECVKKINDNIQNDSFQLKNIHDVRHDTLNNEPLINILVRTSSRPNLFKACMDSIFSQKYSNFRVIICYDTDISLNYLNNQLTNNKCSVFKVNKLNAVERSLKSEYFYNLYCNDLLNMVTDGYIIYLDDDDKLTTPYALYAVQQAIEYSPINSMYVWKFARPDKIIFPPNFECVSIGEIGSSSFCVHHSFPKQRNIIWNAQQNADHNFFTKMLYFPAFPTPNIIVVPYILSKTQKNDRIGHNGLLPNTNTPTTDTINTAPTNTSTTNTNKIKNEDCELNNVSAPCLTNLKEPTISTFYTIFPRFNWMFYVNLYVDLQKLNITTELLAMNHYLLYGRHENRRTHEIVQYNEYNVRKIPYPNNVLAQSISIEYILTSNCYVWISPALQHLREQLIKKYKWEILTEYTTQKDSNKQVVFFGVYTDDDIYAILSCEHLPRYIIWGGEDANITNLHSRQTIIEISRLKSCVHICISECLYRRLIWLFPNAQCIYAYFNLVDKGLFTNNQSQLIDNCVYIYIYNGRSPGKETIYGKSIYEEVIKKLAIIKPNVNFQYIYSSTNQYPHNKMPEIYKKCCIMLRLTKHDGNANSVQECESMNIPVVHNLSNYGLKWSTSIDVVNHICNSLIK